MATKRARVSWKGDLETGAGTIEQVGSGAFGPLAVSWPARTGDESGMTSPEELIAAAHAACFSMAFSARLGKAGTPPDRLEVSATVTFVPGTGITTSELEPHPAAGRGEQVVVRSQDHLVGGVLLMRVDPPAFERRAIDRHRASLPLGVRVIRGRSSNSRRARPGRT